MEQVATYFSNAGVPKTGLSPVVNIWERNGTKRITDGALTEVGGGFYIYNFNEYSSDKQYLFLFDGGDTLEDQDRYNNGSNDMDAYTNKIARGRSGGGGYDYKPDFKDLKKILSDYPKITDKSSKTLLKQLEMMESRLLSETKKNLSDEQNVTRQLVQLIEKNVLSGVDKSSGDINKTINDILGEYIDTLHEKISSESEKTISQYKEMAKEMEEKSESQAKMLIELEDKLKKIVDGSLEDKEIKDILGSLERFNEEADEDEEGEEEMILSLLTND